MLDFNCDHQPFCISRDYVKASEMTGFLVAVDHDGHAVRASPEAIQRLGVSINWVANDLYVSIPASRLRQTCRDATCVVFRMTCEDLTCTWHAAPVMAADVVPALSEVRLTATSPEALERAKANVFVEVIGPGGSRLLPLSALGEGEPAPDRDYRGPIGAAGPEA